MTGSHILWIHAGLNTSGLSQSCYYIMFTHRTHVLHVLTSVVHVTLHTNVLCEASAEQELENRLLTLSEKRNVQIQNKEKITVQVLEGLVVKARST